MTRLTVWDGLTHYRKRLKLILDGARDVRKKMNVAETQNTVFPTKSEIGHALKNKKKQRAPKVDFIEKHCVLGYAQKVVFVDV